MAELTGILSKLSGSAGLFIFKSMNGHAIMSVKASITTVRRSRAQQQWKGNPKPVCEGSQSAPHKAHGHISHKLYAGQIHRISKKLLRNREVLINFDQVLGISMTLTDFTLHFSCCLTEILHS